MPSAGLEFTFTSGNPETFRVGGNPLTATRWDKNEFSANADGAYGQNTTKSVVGGSLISTRSTTGPRSAPASVIISSARRP